MDGVILFELLAIILAILGALAVSLGADSREGFEDAQNAHGAAATQ